LKACKAACGHRRSVVSIRIVQLGSARAPDEGLRIGTVRRPPRGVPKDEFAKRNYYDVWLPLLSPSVVSQAASLSPSGWAALLYLVGPSTVVGNLVMFTLIGRYPAVSRLGVQMYLIPVMSVVGGVLILGESLDAFVLVGGALMLLAVAVAMRIRH